ncbi:hypothetical protein AgCh_034206 [Apium graveolens]
MMWLLVEPFFTFIIFVPTLSNEVLRLLNHVDVVDVSKAFKLPREVHELKILNFKFEENSFSLLAKEMVVDEKAFNLLANNLGLVTECESLSSDVKVL